VKVKGQHSAERKYYEAVFFYRQMKLNVRRPAEFPHYTSAFLSALKSCTEHNCLLAPDSRFKNWYRDIKQSHIANAELQRLFDFRNAEVHQTGTDGFQKIGFDKPAHVRRQDIEIKSSTTKDGETVLLCRFPGEKEFREVKNPSFSWVWNVPGSPDVLKLCYTGLKIVEDMMKLHSGMKFQK
jgi:hypothetical protein